MKYVILHADGMADVPCQQLGGKTPLEAAVTPHMDRLAQNGELGLLTVAPDGLPFGSDAVELAVLGYDLRKYYPGPAPLEATSLGVTVGEHDVVFCCTMVTLRGAGGPSGRSASSSEIKKIGPQVVMDDATAGLIGTEQARELIDASNEQLGSETIQFYPGAGHRNLMVWVGGKARVRCMDPQRIVGRPLGDALPSGDGADVLKKLMDASLIILRDHPVNDERRQTGQKPANCLWLWGQGRAPSWPSLTEQYHLSGTIVASSDLHRGIGMCAGLGAIEPALLAGTEGSDFKTRSDVAVRELGKKDFVYVHAAAPDDVRHGSDEKAKLQVIESFDRDLVGAVVKGLSTFGPYRLLLICDGAGGPADRQGHAPQVLYAFCEGPSQQAQEGTRGFNESDAASNKIAPRDATKLLHTLLPRKF